MMHVIRQQTLDQAEAAQAGERFGPSFEDVVQFCCQAFLPDPSTPFYADPGHELAFWEQLLRTELAALPRSPAAPIFYIARDPPRLLPTSASGLGAMQPVAATQDGHDDWVMPEATRKGSWQANLDMGRDWGEVMQGLYDQVGPFYYLQFICTHPGGDFKAPSASKPGLGAAAGNSISEATHPGGASGVLSGPGALKPGPEAARDASTGPRGVREASQTASAVGEGVDEAKGCRSGARTTGSDVEGLAAGPDAASIAAERQGCLTSSSGHAAAGAGCERSAQTGSCSAAAAGAGAGAVPCASESAGAGVRPGPRPGAGPGPVPSQRGLGLGAALLRHVVSVADQEGKHMFLAAMGPENRDWYLRHGFQEVRYKRYRAQDDDALYADLYYMTRAPRGPEPASVDN